MNTFKASFNQTHENLAVVARLTSMARNMGLKPKVKAHYSIVTVSVQCNTLGEKVELTMSH